MENFSFDQLMNVINGEVKVKGQSGVETVGAAQNLYFGTRFGKNLGVEELVAKCNEELKNVQQYAVNLKAVIDGNQDALSKVLAEKVDKETSKYENYDLVNLDSVIAKMKAIRDAKAAATAN